MSDVTIGSTGMVMKGGCDTGYTVSSDGLVLHGGCYTPYRMGSNSNLWNRDSGVDTGKTLEDFIERPWSF